jgi:hypothetical protein
VHIASRRISAKASAVAILFGIVALEVAGFKRNAFDDVLLDIPDRGASCLLKIAAPD